MSPTRPLTHLSVLALGVTLLGLVPAADAVTTTPRPGAIRAAFAGTIGGDLPDLPYREVAVGYLNTYGLTLDGHVLTAGYDASGSNATPAGLDDVVQVEAGYRHALALDSAGDVTIWGQYGDASPTPTYVPQEVQDADIVQVAAGGNHDLALTSDGTVLAWGLDDGGTDQSPIAVPDALDSATVTDIETGFFTAGAILDDGSVVSWGQLPPTPSSLDGVHVDQLEMGQYTAFAVTDAGDLVVWNEWATGPADVPQEVRDGHVVAIASAELGAVAALDDGTLHGWGGEAPAMPTTTGGPIAGVEMDRYTTAVEYATIAALSEPTLSAAPVFGEPVTVGGATWTSAPEETHYAWSSDGDPVGTDSPTYTPSADDVDRQLSVTVTVTAGELTGSATSAPATVAPASFTSGPQVAIEGVARVGRVLSRSVTTTVPAATSTDVSWLRDGEVVSTADTYRLRAGDLGHQVSVSVTAYRGGYASTSAHSAPVTVAPGAAKLAVSAPGTVTRGAKARVRAAGLLAGESYVVRLDGTKVAAGHASAAGKVDVQVKVPRTARTGRRTLAVVGSYADRTGRQTVIVKARRR